MAETTVKFYTELKAEQAVMALDEVITVRREAAQTPIRRAPTKRVA